MVSATTVHWFEILSNPLQIGIVVYLIIGFIVVRGMKLRRPPNNGPLWEKKDNARNRLFLLQSILLLSPIAFLIEVALWPLVILFLWAYQPDGND